MGNKVVLVTGSTSGIGEGIAKAFAGEGHNIILNGFGERESIEKIKKEIIGLGAKEVFYVPADLSEPKEINSAFDSILEKFGRIDILVNNAGIQFVSPIEDFPPEKWEEIIRVNLISSFYTIKRALPEMKKSGWGRIINIASCHGLVASPFKSAYVAAKHGIVGLTKSVALEAGPFSVTVNAICPGYVKTPLVLNQIADTARVRGISEEEVVKKVLLEPQATGRFVEIEEIAELAKFLCSEKSGSVTGAALTIDGGWTSR